MEISEKERFFTNNKKLLSSKDYKGWKITVFELPAEDKDGNKFVAECSKKPDFKKTTPVSKSEKEAYRVAYSLVDQENYIQEKLQRFRTKYKVFKPLYLMIIYFSGHPEYHSPYQENIENEKYEENFIRIQFKFRNGFDFDVLKELEAEGLLKISPSKENTTITMNKEGIIEAKNILKTINLDGVDAVIQQRQQYMKEIHYQHQQDFLQEQD